MESISVATLNLLEVIRFFSAGSTEDPVGTFLGTKLIQVP
jgi:hypothetical protein